MPCNAGGLRFARQVSEANAMPHVVMNMLEFIHISRMRKRGRAVRQAECSPLRVCAR